MDPVEIDFQTVLQIAQTVGVIAFVWWRQNKVDQELIRVRDRLHDLEGRPEGGQMMDVVRLLNDRNKELTDHLLSRP